MVLLNRIKARWLQVLVHVGALAPLAWILWAYWQGLFLIDPIREITTITGKTALILLLLSLATTPVNTLLGFKQVLRVRRALGLFAFLYASLHFATFVGLDYGFDLHFIWQAIVDQRFVLAGMGAGLLLLALAVTSTKGWQKRLGKTWKRLHQFAYLAGILAVVHFMWLVKDIREPLRYGVILAFLLVLRLPRVRRAVSRARHHVIARLRSHPRPNVTT